MEFLIPILLIVTLGAGIGLYTVFLYKRVNSGNKDDKEWARHEVRKRIAQGEKIAPFLNPKTITFFEALKNALPGNYIIFPNVSTELLFHYTRREALSFKNQYADFVVFTPNYVPVLVIDLMDYSSLNNNTVHMKSYVKEIIVKSGIPALDYGVCDIYSIDDLRRKIAEKMNPLANK
jgi:hypothetical protein